ncbi:MAG: GAF domain-containing protein [Methylotenera sp.]|nr:GAF domain-containing protein [Methylotenera sp.]
MITMPKDASFIGTAEEIKEGAHISVVRKKLVINSQYETLLNSITKLAATICNLPVAILTLVDEENIWISSEVEAPGVTRLPRRGTFSSWVVTNDNYLEITDTMLGISHLCHPWKTDWPNYKFHASAPLKLPMGEVIGALCVFDVKPNKITVNQKEMLVGLADTVAKALVIRNNMVQF